MQRVRLLLLLSTIKDSLNEPAWSGSGVEAYVFASLPYFVFCFAMSAYSKRLERPSVERAAARGADAA